MGADCDACAAGGGHVEDGGLDSVVSERHGIAIADSDLDRPTGRRPDRQHDADAGAEPGGAHDASRRYPGSGAGDHGDACAQLRRCASGRRCHRFHGG